MVDLIFNYCLVLLLPIYDYISKFHINKNITSIVKIFSETLRCTTVSRLRFMHHNSSIKHHNRLAICHNWEAPHQHLRPLFSAPQTVRYIIILISANKVISKHSLSQKCCLLEWFDGWIVREVPGFAPPPVSCCRRGAHRSNTPLFFMDRLEKVFSNGSLIRIYRIFQQIRCWQFVKSIFYAFPQNFWL